MRILALCLLLFQFKLFLPSAYSTEDYPSIPNEEQVNPSAAPVVGSIDSLKHRFGLGLQLGGEASLYGILASAYLRQDMSFELGMGTAYDYNAYFAGFHYYLLGYLVRPFVKGSVALWQSAGTPQPFPPQFPSFLKSKFLSNEAQKIDLLFLNPALGAQLELDSGLKISAEILWLIHPLKLTANPFAALAAIFYF